MKSIEKFAAKKKARLDVLPYLCLSFSFSFALSLCLFFAVSLSLSLSASLCRSLSW